MIFPRLLPGIVELDETTSDCSSKLVL